MHIKKTIAYDNCISDKLNFKMCMTRGTSIYELILSLNALHTGSTI